MGFRQAVDRIGRIGRTATDSRALRVGVLTEINRVVAFDAYVWALTDPETCVGTAPIAAVPPALMPVLPQLIRLKYLSAVNRWTGLRATARLAEPDSSRVWRELLHAHGVTDVASTVFRDRYGCWAFLDLWRTGGTFTRSDTAFLDGIADPLTAGLRRCQAETFVAGPRGRSEHGPVVLLLTADLQVRGQTPETHEYLARLVPPSEGMAPVPASAYNVAAQLIAVEEGVDAHPPYARVHLTDGRWLTLRAARLDPGAQIAVTIEDTSPGERTAVFARASGLSARETELLTHLLTGADTRAVAGRMLLSENTVQDHLKSIFDKTGTRSRRTLLSHALGSG